MHKGQERTTLNANGEAEAAAKSRGEKLFDGIVYGGFGWVGNALTSIYLGNLFRNGPGKPVFDYLGEKLGKSISDATSISRETAENTVRSNLILSALILGGTLMLLPMKFLLDRKPKTVEKLDNVANKVAAAVGSSPTPEELREQEKCHEQLQTAPKQSWTSMLSGRVAGLGVVFAIALGIMRGKDEKLAEKGAEGIGKLLNHLPGKSLKNLDKSEKFRNIGQMAIIDFAYSALCTAVLYAVSKCVAAFTSDEKKAKKAAQASNTATADNPSMPTTAGEPEQAVTLLENTPPARARNWRKDHAHNHHENRVELIEKTNVVQPHR